MKLLAKSPIAIAVMVLSILFSSFFGCGRSLKKLRHDVENYFYDGDGGDGYSIQNDIQTLSANVNNLKVIASRYTDTVDGLEEKITRMNDARRALTDTKNIEDKYAAVSALIDEVNSVYNALVPDDMNKTDRGFRSSLYEDIMSTVQRISHNGYNDEVLKFNSALDKFPAKQIARLLGINPMPLYN